MEILKIFEEKISDVFWLFVESGIKIFWLFVGLDILFFIVCSFNYLDNGSVFLLFVVLTN